MKKFFKLTIVLILSTISIQRNCYAGKPRCCFNVQKYKNEQVFNEKKFVKEYLSKNLEFIKSPFFIKQVLFIPFTELSQIVEFPNLKFYFRTIMKGHTLAIKNNPIALMKFIVENQRIYGPVVCSYLRQNPKLVQGKSRGHRLARVFKELQTLLIGQQVFSPPQLTVAAPEVKDNQVPNPLTSELNTETNETNKKAHVCSLIDIFVEGILDTDFISTDSEENNQAPNSPTSELTSEANETNEKIHDPSSIDLLFV